MLLPVMNCKKPANLLSLSDLMNFLRWLWHIRFVSELGSPCKSLITRFDVGLFSSYILYKLDASQNSGKDFKAYNSLFQTVAIYFGFWISSRCANSSNNDVDVFMRWLTIAFLAAKHFQKIVIYRINLTI